MIGDTPSTLRMLSSPSYILGKALQCIEEGEVVVCRSRNEATKSGSAGKAQGIL